MPAFEAGRRGDAIRRDAAAALERMGVAHGLLEVEDNGALPFALEAASATGCRSSSIVPRPSAGRGT
jgi:citrate lyase gamma subunit